MQQLFFVKPYVVKNKNIIIKFFIFHYTLVPNCYSNNKVIQEFLYIIFSYEYGIYNSILVEKV